MKKLYFLNDELIRLLEQHKMRPIQLVRRMNSDPALIYTLKSKRRSLGEELFVKILRKGFGYSKSQTEKIFLAAVKKKYLD